MISFSFYKKIINLKKMYSASLSCICWCHSHCCFLSLPVSWAKRPQPLPLCFSTSACFSSLRHGLGKDLEGRAEPVEVELLPPGKFPIVGDCSLVHVCVCDPHLPPCLSCFEHLFVWKCIAPSMFEFMPVLLWLGNWRRSTSNVDISIYGTCLVDG